MTYRFKIDEIAVTILHWKEGVEKEDSHKYNVSQLSLGATREENSASEWVMQVSEKSWATKSMLYELAAIIQRYKPDNNIDWLQTFLPIEDEHSTAQHTSTDLEQIINNNLIKFGLT